MLSLKLIAIFVGIKNIQMCIGKEIGHNMKHIPTEGNATDAMEVNEAMKKLVNLQYETGYVNIENFPHAVYLMVYSDGARLTWSCGSTVLTQRLLLTAGHCLRGCGRKAEITAFAGHSNYLKANEVKKVRKYIIHGDYDSSSSFADIAIMFLIADLHFGNTIKRAIIGPVFPRIEYNHYMVAGWGHVSGRLEEIKHKSTKLKMVRQNVHPVRHCNKYLIMMKGTMCATKEDTPGYSLIGDPGSALVTRYNQVVGLVSYKANNDVDMIIYTNISYYYKWIKHYAYDLKCSG